MCRHRACIATVGFHRTGGSTQSRGRGGGAVRHALHMELGTWSHQAKSHVGADIGVVRKVIEASMSLKGEVPSEKCPGLDRVQRVTGKQRREGDPSPGQKCTRG